MAYKVLDVCRHVINYSNEKKYGVSNLKLQKLLYFIQAYFLLRKDEVCFAEIIEAWDLGPVVPVAYHEYKQFGSSNIPTITFLVNINETNPWDTSIVAYHDTIIAADDKTLIDAVIDNFSKYSASDLVGLTHRQRPWIDAYAKTDNKEITRESIKEYFNAR